MTLHALYMRMGRNLIRRKLRIHHRMAGLPAKAGTIHVTYRAIGELAGDHDVDERSEDYEGAQTPQFKIAKIQRRKAGRQIPGIAFTPFAPGDAQRDKN